MRFMALFAAVVWGLSPAALAQDEMPGDVASYLPATVREVERLASASGMGADAASSAKALVTSMQEAFERETRRMRRENERMSVTHDPTDQAGLAEAYARVGAKWEENRAQTTKTFLSDLRALLPDGSDEAWASFERRRHRRQMLHQNWWSGGTDIDLVDFAERNKFDGFPGVAEVLAAYEVELDRALVAREPLDQKYAGLSMQPPDAAAPSDAAKQYTAMRDANCAVMRVEREFWHKLLAALPEDKRGAARDLRLAAEPSYYSFSSTVRQRATKLVASGRLDAERRAKLEAAAKTFDERTRALNEKNIELRADSWCAMSYEQTQAGEVDGEAWQKWGEDGRKLQVELLRAIDAVATEDDLDFVDKQIEAEAAASNAVVAR